MLGLDYLLAPLSSIYGLTSTIRNLLYDNALFGSYISSLPVISVGNITVGGSGKTPLCITIGELLTARGYRPIVLSRGYGGSEKGPYQVCKTDDPKRVGDEPALMAQEMSVVISRSRSRGAKFIEEHNLADIIILDDGFQHRALHRNLDIVSVDVGTPDAIEKFLKGALLPLGRFRERRGPALERADLIMLSERRIASEKSIPDKRLLALFSSKHKIFRSIVKPKGIFSLISGESVDLQKVVAFCGIANPENFFLTLKSLGLEVAGQYPYRDHFPFRAETLQTLRNRHPEVPLICTSKDAVKLKALPPQDLENVFELKIETEIFPSDAFMTALLRGLQSRKDSKVVDFIAKEG